MRKNALPAFLLLIPFAVFAQIEPFEMKRSFSLEISEPYEVVDGKKKSYFYHNGEIHKITEKGKTIIFQKLETNSLKELDKKVFEDVFEEKALTRYIYKSAGSYFLIYKINENKDWPFKKDHDIIFAIKLDSEKMTIDRSPIKLLEIENGAKKPEDFPWFAKGSIYYNSNGIQESYSLSKDSSKILIQYREEKKSKKSTENFTHIYAFDNELNKLWSRRFDLGNINELDFSIDAEARAYILFSLPIEKRTIPGTNLGIYRYADQSSKKEALLFDIEGKVTGLNRIRIDEFNNNSLILTGFFSNNADISLMIGAFSIVIDKTLKDPNSAFIEFEKDFKLSYTKEFYKGVNTPNTKITTLADLELVKVVFSQDGTGAIIGERREIKNLHNRVRIGEIPMGYSTSHFNDIIIVKLEPKGDLGWYRKLPKKQYQDGWWNNTGLISFKHRFSNNYHIFVFPDNAKNAGFTFKDAPKLYRISYASKGVISAFKVSHDTGKIERYSLFEMSKIPTRKGTIRGYQYFLDRIVPLPNNQAAVELYKKKGEDILIKAILE